MTDLHTHILPGIDDGARDVEESIALLRMEAEQGITKVVLTPHFYRDRENPKHFLEKRRKAAVVLNERLMNLPEEEQCALPGLIMGAEVLWVPNMAEWEELPALCIAGTKNLLLELPFGPWRVQMIDDIYGLISRTGITPIIAHLERYLPIQRWELINEVLGLGVPVQVTGDVLVRRWKRRSALELMGAGCPVVVASDCHRVDSRPPVIGAALDVLEKKRGIAYVEAMLRCANKLAGG